MRIIRAIDNLLQAKAARYLVAGGTAFATEYGVFLLLFYIVHLQAVVIANIISFIAGLIVSFTLNKTWVFKGDHTKKVGHQFVLYMSLAGVNLLITSVAIYWLVSLGIKAFIAKFIVIVAIAVWNFALFKTIIFRNK